MTDLRFKFTSQIDEPVELKVFGIQNKKEYDRLLNFAKIAGFQVTGDCYPGTHIWGEWQGAVNSQGMVQFCTREGCSAKAYD